MLPPDVHHEDQEDEEYGDEEYEEAVGFGGEDIFEDEEAAGFGGEDIFEDEKEFDTMTIHNIQR